ncbi:MAG: right-handed parallel beta-helix repeat-containing protein, partial [Planctomycetota bacterium]
GFENVICQNVGGTGFAFGGGANDATEDTQCENCYVVNCTVTESSRSGINAFSGGHINTTISGNRLHKIRGIGIEWASSPVTISNNILDDVFNAGITMEGVVGADDGWSNITGNVLRDIGKYHTGSLSSPGIQLGQSGGSNKVLVANNSLFNIYGQGIVVGGGGRDDLFIVGNIIDGFGIDGDLRTPSFGDYHGIKLGTGNERNFVMNNVVMASSGADDAPKWAYVITGTDIWFEGNVAQGTFDDGVFQVATSAGTAGSGTRARIGNNNMDITTGLRYMGGDVSNNERWPILPDEATPSVAGSDMWKTGGTTSITDFDDGYDRQKITVLAAHAVLITDGTNILLNGSTDWTMEVGDTLSLAYRVLDGKWYEIGRHYETPPALVSGADGTNQGTLTLWDGAGGVLPGYIKIHSPNGTAWYLFVEDDGTLKVHNAAPTANADGSEVGSQS